MVEKLSLRDKVANYVYYYPESSLNDIAEGTGIEKAYAYKLLRQLIYRKQVRSFRVGQTSAYVSTGELKPVFSEPKYYSPHSSAEIRDCERLIDSLRARGLYRRAKTELRRLSAMQNSAAGVEAVARRMVGI
ncbi:MULTISPECIES: hypothetical protein [Klebsiella pneumoniae complex]|uniref:hypothetical protein n=1 Tax=Klebsiella pneumoniae complex TaxID=3390273 RepID=UPI001F4A86E1|nr:MULTISPECIES: hypothetical protein [Klebsiella]HBW3346626.1 hypothetical protein [Klebsiella pneumoniae]